MTLRRKSLNMVFEIEKPPLTWSPWVIKMSDTHTWTENDILKLLDENAVAVERGLGAIFKRHTKTEQRTDDARVFNSLGFSAFDAKRGSYYARWIMSGRHFSGNHAEKALALAKKYRKQLMDIANGGVIGA